MKIAICINILLLCSGFNSKYEVLFLCHIFTQRSMANRKIERSNGRDFGRQQRLANSRTPSKFSFQMKKNKSSLPEIYKALKPCSILNWVSIARVVACFLQTSWSQPAATAADSETPCVCAGLSDPRKQSRRAAPRAWSLNSPSKPKFDSCAKQQVCIEELSEERASAQIRNRTAQRLQMARAARKSLETMSGVILNR